MKLLDTDSETTLLMNVWLQVYSSSIMNGSTQSSGYLANIAVQKFREKFLDYSKNED